MRACAIAAAVILSLTGTTLAHPLDSPGTVYIDGVPCNLSCQSYMAWSRQTLKASRTAVKGAADVSDAKREVPRKRISKHVEPASPNTLPRKKAGDAQAALLSKPKPAPPPMPRNVPLDLETRDAPAAIAADPAPLSVPQPLSESGTRNAEPSGPPKERTPHETVMAALAVAAQMTSAETPKVIGDDRTDEPKADAANLPPARNVNNLVAVLIARPDVKSATALKDQNVAIDKAESGYEMDIRFALIAAGATGAELSVTDVSPIDRVVNGDVQAAVLKLVSPEAAEAFPDVKGLKVLRVPLTPR